MADDGDRGRIGERLLLVIDEGRRVATYKLALILALMDAAAEHVDDLGRAPDVLTTRQVAAHVLRLVGRIGGGHAKASGSVARW